ncbi:MAG TPA: tyrosine-type recombinase/integrase [Spirochaetia bacterium]|nr:tyrosine-type recombinase/integrase [Spirochaetia bacterium]
MGQVGQSGLPLGQPHFSGSSSIPDKISTKWVSGFGETGPKTEPSGSANPSSSEQDLIRSFVERQRAKGVRSLRKVPYILKVFFSYLNERGLLLADLTPLGAEEFQTYLSTMETDGIVHYASSTVGDIVREVDGFYKWLAAEGLVLANPFYGLRHVKREIRLPRTIPNQVEMAAHLERLRSFHTRPTVRERRTWYRLHVIAELLYGTGMRIGELAVLTSSDFDFDDRTVTVREGKGGITRTAFLSDYAASVVKFYITEMRDAVNYRHSRDTLFGVSGGRALDCSLNEQLRSLFGFTSHSFRHAVGTHLLQRGCDLRFIQLILGHDDLKSTALYTRVSKEELRDQLDSFHPRKGG